MPSIPPHLPTRDELRLLIADLDDTTKTTLAAAWPPNVPGLKGDHQHTVEERQAIYDVLRPLAKAEGLAGVERCMELKVRLVALPDDLRDQVNEQGLAAEIPHLDRHEQVTAGHGQTLDRLISDGEQVHAERRRRVHAALTAAGLNDDDTRHAIIRQLTARVASSNQVTGDEADWIVDAATRVELDEAGLIISDAGAPTIVDRDRQPLGPRPVDRDWPAWCKAHKVTQKTVLETARTAAFQLQLDQPNKVAEITHPALVAAVYAALDHPAEPTTVAPTAPAVGSDDGGGESSQPAPAGDFPNPPTPTLIVVHSRDGIEVIPITNPQLAADAVAHLKAVS